MLTARARPVDKRGAIAALFYLTNETSGKVRTTELSPNRHDDAGKVEHVGDECLCLSFSEYDIEVSEYGGDNKDYHSRPGQ